MPEGSCSLCSSVVNGTGWRLEILFSNERSPKFSVFCNRNSDFDNEQLDEIEQKVQAKNTKRTTELGLKKFEKWCKERKITVHLKPVQRT